MYKDPTEWREGFKRWKETGESPWSAGKRLPSYLGGKGKIRRRLYNNIMPMGYDRPVSRIIDALLLNKQEGERDFKLPSDHYKTLNSLWGEYLSIPNKDRVYLSEKDGVRRYEENGKQYISLNNPKVISPDIKSAVLGGMYKTIGENGDWYYSTDDPAPFNKNVNILSNFVLGDFLTQRKVDPSRGEYVQYTDTWDINPYQKTENLYGLLPYEEMSWYDKVASKIVNNYVKNHPGKDASFGIGNPLNIKGRIYLEDLYGVPKGSTAPDVGDYYGGWLPELEVTKYMRNGKYKPLKVKFPKK